jgi:hypothetical protein
VTSVSQVTTSYFDEATRPRSHEAINECGVVEFAVIVNTEQVVEVYGGLHDDN